METLQRTANRGSISTGYDIDNSLKMEADNTESMTRTPSSSGNRKTWTVSFWFKRTELGAAVRLFEAWDGSKGTSSLFTDTDFFILDLNTASNYFTSSQVFRDTSAWYHFVVRVDTTSATDSERVRVYVNGSELVGSWTGGYIGQNTDLTWNQNVVHYLGVFHATSNFANGYYAEVINVDGTSLAPTEFGEFDEDTGIWKPKEYEGTYGTNGFYLDFENSGSLGADSSGNGNNFTLNNITAADQATDTPTNNFCTWNPLQTGWNTNYGTGQVIVEGATEAYASTNYAAIEGSMAVQSGKWYWESKPNRTGGIMVGVAALNGIRWAGDTAYWYLGMNAQGIGTILGNFYYNGSVVSTDATDWTNGDIVSIALDMDNYKIYMAVNGSWGGTSNPATGTGGYDFSSASNFTSNFVVPAGRIETANSSYVIETNFGGYTTMSIASGNSDSSGYGNFEYAPPSGYYALCTKNLAEYG